MLHRIKKIYSKYFKNKNEEVEQLKNEIENIRIELEREQAKNAYLLKKFNMLLINAKAINNPLYFMQEQHIYEEIKEQTTNEHIYENIKEQTTNEHIYENIKEQTTNEHIYEEIQVKNKNISFLN